MVKFPLATEKSIRMIEAENKLVFVIDRRTQKRDVKEQLEKLFKVKVVKVNTLIGSDGKKRAYVRFADDTPAIDLATQLGIM